MPNILEKEILEKIKADLLNKKEQIVEELGQMARKENNSGDDEYRATFPEYGDKPDENAQEIAEYTTNIAEEQLLENELRDIEKALDRIEKGDYGTCRHCGQPINPKRLLARPTSSSCIPCKTKLQNS